MKYLDSMLAEIKLNLKVMLSYKTGIINNTLVTGVLYFCLLFTGAGTGLASAYNSTAADSKSLLLIGYVFWSFSNSAINRASNSIQGETVMGTLEQKYLSIVPLPFLLFGGLAASLMVEALEIGAIILISEAAAGVGISISIYAVASLFITLAGMYGIGLIFGGAALAGKSIGQLTYITQIILLFASGTIFSTSFGGFAKVVPLNTGIDIARKAVCGIQPSYTDFGVLLLVSLFWLAAGGLVFNAGSRYTRKNGMLGSY